MPYETEVYIIVAEQVPMCNAILSQLRKFDYIKKKFSK